MVSLDSFRVSAVEQCGRDAELIGFPFDVPRVTGTFLAGRVRALGGVLASDAGPEITAVVITKLDETDQVGGVMHGSLASELVVAYPCGGDRVPEDIHDAAVDNSLDAIFPEQA